MTILNSDTDFHWYKKDLEVSARQDFKHINTPIKYPCKVLNSEFEYNDNGLDWMIHSFTYQVTLQCPCCKQERTFWHDEIKDEI